MVSLCLGLKAETAELSAQVPVVFAFPPVVNGSSVAPHSHHHLVLSVFDFGFSNRYVVVPLCSDCSSLIYDAGIFSYVYFPSLSLVKCSDLFLFFLSF
jgi:hypothetical protein